ncbi:MAG: ABC transporter ATP-binding protein [Clostridia bacterium]|nr:ABC transporter ATP-binding protein [Clostridia bacterium]
MKISLQNVTKEFISKKNASEKVIAVNDFTYDVPEGKLIGLLGPSGCGKSTVLNLICGLEKPTSGKIFFDGEDVSFVEPEYRGVGLVFQNYALYPHLTVRQNIIFPLRNLKGKDKMTKQQMFAKADEVAGLVQLGGLMDRRPAELSGGQQQRVAIARALVKIPRILLLDEPLSNLDARLRLQTREELKRIQRETGITTVFVTHDQEEAMSISDHIIVMNAGVINQIGPPQDVYDDPVNLFTAKFLGTPPINVFNGTLKDKGVYIGGERVLDFDHPGEMPVYVGIRPEGFIISDDGSFTSQLKAVEVMGRDTSIVSTHPECLNAVIRSIVDTQTVKNIGADKVRFELRPSKVLLFDRETEKRIYPETEAENK